MVNGDYPKQGNFAHDSDWSIAMSSHAADMAKDHDFARFAAVSPFAAAVITSSNHGDMSVLTAAFEEYERWRYLVTN